MAEEGEEWKEEPEIWQSNRLSGFGERLLPQQWQFNHLAILNEKKEVVPVGSVYEWGEWFEKREKRRVAETTVNGFWVSTVFLGINHGYGGEPQWFETMVFDDKEGSPPPPEIGVKVRQFLGGFQMRYPTWVEAEKGHAAIVETIRYGLF